MKRRWWQRGIFDPYGNFQAKRQGRKDGALNLPPWKAIQQPEYLRELFAGGTTTLEGLAQQWHNLDEKFLTCWHEARLNVGVREDSLSSADDAVEYAQHYYDAVHGRRLATETAKWQRKLYWPFVVSVLACEFPFNSLSFQLYAESEYTSWVITGMIALTLMACAHFLGENLNHKASDNPKIMAFRILMALIPTAVIACVARLRTSYVEQQGISTLGESTLMTINIVLNLGLFAAVAYYSYRVHEPATMEVLKALTHHERLKKAHDSAKAIEVKARTVRTKKYQQVLDEANALLSEVRRRSALYRREHIRKRSDRDHYPDESPNWFSAESGCELTRTLRLDLEWPEGKREPSRITNPVQRIRGAS